MSSLNVNLGHPVVRREETTTGALMGLGARFVMDGGDSDAGSGWWNIRSSRVG